MNVMHQPEILTTSIKVDKISHRQYTTWIEMKNRMNSGDIQRYQAVANFDLSESSENCDR